MAGGSVAWSGAAALPAAAISPLSLTWTQLLADTGGPVAVSSPNVANLAGGPAVVVGDRKGNVWAFNLATGNLVSGWPFRTGVAIDATPSVAAIGPSGLDSVFVGVGNAASAPLGGYQAIGPSGADLWFHTVVNPPTDPLGAYSMVSASMAVGDLQGPDDVVAPSVGQEMYAFNGATGATLSGFPFFQGDGDFATPALADLYHNGQTEIVDAADSSPGVAYGHQYPQGGILRVISPDGGSGEETPAITGDEGTAAPLPGELCEYDTDQTLESSAAVGEFLGSSQAVGIVFGTSDFFAGASDTDKLIAVDSHCNLLWEASLDGVTADSPALADVLGNGQLQVVEGTNIGDAFASGTVYVVNGANGAVDWSAPAAGAIVGSITTADLTGQGYQDLIVPTTEGVQIFDGRSGQVVANLELDEEGFQNAPLITNDPNGTLGITIAGYTNQNQGVIDHFEMANPGGVNVDGNGAWPMFHHDAQLTGDAGTPITIEVPCSPPKGVPAGYEMAGSDGGVFNFGNLPFCGSTGALVLNQPVVGLALTADAGGYWTVARDGGIFAFGDAGSLGSLPGLGVRVANIVGMVPTGDGRGYLLVGNDGGTFAFGDAAFRGSLPGLGVHVVEHRGHRADAERPGVLDGRRRRRGLRLRRRPICRVAARSRGPRVQYRGHRADAERPRVLDGRRRRRGVRLRRRRHSSGRCPARGSTWTTSWVSRRRRAGRATSWSAPTAGCSPSVTPPSTAPCPASASSPTTSSPSPAHRGPAETGGGDRHGADRGPPKAEPGAPGCRSPPRWCWRRPGPPWPPWPGRRWSGRPRPAASGCSCPSSRAGPTPRRMTSTSAPPSPSRRRMSPNLAGGPAVVVGDRAGFLYALSLATGRPVVGDGVWASTASPIDSTPSVAALGGSAEDSVFVGSGNAAEPQGPANGYWGFSPDGQLLFATPVDVQASDPVPDNGVQASLTVADLQGQTAVVAGSLDQEEYALGASSGAALTGWPFFTSDSVFSTAAVADLYGTGHTEIIDGGDQSTGFALGQSYTEGGHLRIFSDRGDLICHYDTNQTVDSSPAVGGFLANGATGAVFGTGSFFPGASATDTVQAVNSDCGLQWSVTLDGATTSSPALADVLGNGGLQVVEGTDTGSGGSVWALNGATGQTLWKTTIPNGGTGHRLARHR